MSRLDFFLSQKNLGELTLKPLTQVYYIVASVGR